MTHINTWKKAVEDALAADRIKEAAARLENEVLLRRKLEPELIARLPADRLESSPLLRKALGEALLERGDLIGARRELSAAVAGLAARMLQQPLQSALSLLSQVHIRMGQLQEAAPILQFLHDEWEQGEEAMCGDAAAALAVGAPLVGKLREGCGAQHYYGCAVAAYDRDGEAEKAAWTLFEQLAAGAASLGDEAWAGLRLNLGQRQAAGRIEPAATAYVDALRACLQGKPGATKALLEREPAVGQLPSPYGPLAQLLLLRTAGLEGDSAAAAALAEWFPAAAGEPALRFQWLLARCELSAARSDLPQSAALLREARMTAALGLPAEAELLLARAEAWLPRTADTTDLPGTANSSDKPDTPEQPGKSHQRRETSGLSSVPGVADSSDKPDTRDQPDKSHQQRGTSGLSSLPGVADSSNKPDTPEQPGTLHQRVASDWPSVPDTANSSYQPDLPGTENLPHLSDWCDNKPLAAPSSEAGPVASGHAAQSQQAAMPGKDEALAAGWQAALFGGLTLEREGRIVSEIRWKRSKTRELFVYLLLHPDGGVRREEVTEALFPESEADKADNRFYVTAHQLKQVLRDYTGAEQAVAIKDGIVRLRTGLVEAVDVQRYELEMRVADQLWPEDRPAAVKLYERAMKRYGAVAPEVSYADWLEQARERLLERQLEAMRRVAEQAEGNFEYARAERIYRERIVLQPLAEPNYRPLLRLLASQGKRGEAEALYRQLEKRLAAELDERPTPETKALLEGAGTVEYGR